MAQPDACLNVIKCERYPFLKENKQPKSSDTGSGLDPHQATRRLML
jgi:hypothetical protein